MLRAVILLSASLAATALPFSSESDAYYWYEFGKFTTQYGKQYADADAFHAAFTNFQKNLARVNAHNGKASSYQMAVNSFADLSREEFAKARLGFNASGALAARSGDEHVIKGNAAASVDWRQKGLVAAVKDQGSCGSCWAFSTIASLESAHAKAAGKLVTLSEQQLVDCSTSFGNNGCDGGLMDNAFTYLINATKGDDTEASYPYRGVDGTCAYKAASVGAQLKSFKDVPAQNEQALLDAVATVGVVSVAIDASDDFMYYEGGIFDSTDCSSDPSSLNHGVAVVGYGTEAGKDYWIVRNSWGSSWGENGYVRMARGKNMCGIADCASYPVV